MKKIETVIKWIITGGIIVMGFVALFSIQSCGSVPYNTEYKIDAIQIIKDKEWDSGTKTHIVYAKDGGVYRIFHVPNTKRDSSYTLVKRYSYGRERHLEFYYVNR